MNTLCKVMNAVVRHATASANASAASGFDFECCQCYLSKLPETGHTDDVQLGALGANDDYGSAIDPPSRRLADASSSPRRLADVTSSAFERRALRARVAEQRTGGDASPAEACAVCGAGGDWIEDLCLNPATAALSCPRGAARLYEAAGIGEDAPAAERAAAVCAVVDPPVFRRSGDHHPCCLCHAAEIVSPRRRLAEGLAPLRVDAGRKRNADLAGLDHVARRRLASSGGSESTNMACFGAGHHTPRRLRDCIFARRAARACF